MDVASANAEEQPFVRCARCEADNNRFAHACIHCGQTLDDEVTRSFNERFWSERRAAQVSEADAHREHEQQLNEIAMETANERRAMAEAVARDAGDRARARWSSDMEGTGPAVGWSWLAGLPPWARWTSSSVCSPSPWRCSPMPRGDEGARSTSRR